MSAITLAERRHWIGASESAALLGVSPFATAYTLWCRKSGLIPDEDLDGVERVDAGRFLEPGIAAWAAARWDWPLHKAETYVPHPRVPRMGCSPDYLTETGGPVEIKNVDFLQFRDHWTVEEDELVDAPVHYLIQVQHQLACLGQDAGWLVVCVGGNQLYRMPVPAHPGLIARLETEVARFWGMVAGGQEPPPDFARDAQAVAARYARTRADTRPVDFTHDDRLDYLAWEYCNARTTERAAKAEAEACRARILAHIQDARAALTRGHRISAPPTKSGRTLRVSALTL